MEELEQIGNQPEAEPDKETKDETPSFSSVNCEQMLITEEADIVTEFEKQRLDDAEKKVKKPVSRKKKIFKSVFFLFLNVGIVVGVLLYQLLGTESSVTSISELFATSVNWGFFVLLIGIAVLLTFAHVVKLTLFSKMATGKYHIATCYKAYVLGKHYDNLTPFGSGGQPFQVYYLRKRGFDGRSALSVPMGSYVTWQFCFVTISMIVMLAGIPVLTSQMAENLGGAFIYAGGWIGVSINAVLFLAVLLPSISKKVGGGIIKGVFKFLHKIRIIKNYEKRFDQTMKFAADYQATMRKYMAHKAKFTLITFLTAFDIVVHYSLPFFVFLALSKGTGGTVDWFTLLAMGLAIEMMASVMPTPGGAGVSEIAFTAMMGPIFEASGMTGTIFWAILIWRILNYYGYLFQGTIVIIYDSVYGNRKYEWQTKKKQLVAESEEFKEEQLRSFEKEFKKIERIKSVRKKTNKS